METLDFSWTSPASGTRGSLTSVGLTDLQSVAIGLLEPGL